MKYNVLVTPRSFGQGSPKPLEILTRADCAVTRNPHGRLLSEEELLQSIGEFDGIIVGLEGITRRVIECGVRLKVISKHGVGVDNIDLRAAAEKGIVVTNTPGVNSHAVADLAVGLMLSIARQIPRNAEIAKNCGKKGMMGRELYGKTVGIVGLGRIGREVAQRVCGFSTNVFYHDEVRQVEAEAALGVRFSGLDALVSQSDFISLHLPLMPQTERLFDGRLLRLMKPDSYLINTSRAEIVDEDELSRALVEGRLSGAAVDVYREDSPLLGLDNAICLPHVGAYTYESVESMGILSAENLVSVLRGEPPQFRVNQGR